MEIKEYQKNSFVAIREHSDKKDEVMNWLIGLSEETGELVSLFKHHYYGDEEISKVEIAKEAGDVLWYLSALCTTLGISLDTVAALNVSKLQHRFPTDSFDSESSARRHEAEKKFEETEKYQELIDCLMWPPKSEER